MTSRLARAFTAAALLLSVTPSGAQGAEAAEPAAPRRLAIFASLLGDDFGNTTPFRERELFERAAKSAELRPDLEIVPYDEVLSDDTVSLTTVVRDCGADVRCTAEAFARVKADLGLRVLVNLSLEPPLLVLKLIEPATARTLQDQVVELDRSRALLDQVSATVGDLLEHSGFQLGGELQVAASPADARVRISGPRTLEVGSTARLALPAGRYEIEAVRGESVARATAVVLVGQSARAALAVPAETNSRGVPWLWIAIGVGAAVAGTTALFATGVLGGSQVNHPCACVTTAQSLCSRCE